MKVFNVLGSGCTKCQKTADLIQKIAAEQGVTIELNKVTSPETIMGYGVMSTPAVVVDEQLVHSGSIPDRASVESWLTS
ncbi:MULTISPECIES: thioredoxin family protein [Oceanospirillaceae]|jgi:small redox-active disulfide protein 2|uniref:Thioredoxin family protein n=1 Tax=Oceanobacter antarcticus TaxID=3133425 RepID=A0ABW8NDH3_9GAMM|tara:strand:- start:5834 stop:6070 length:237 start_codon:yes stop_codon:yes gene_type:complete